MAKEKSFMDKIKKGAKKDTHFSMVRYVDSVVSEKTGQYRFQESMLKIPEGMSLDNYLKKLSEEESTSQEVADGMEDTELEKEESKEDQETVQVVEDAKGKQEESKKKQEKEEGAEEPVVDEVSVEVKETESQKEEEIVTMIQSKGKSKKGN